MSYVFAKIFSRIKLLKITLMYVTYFTEILMIPIYDIFVNESSHLNRAFINSDGSVLYTNIYVCDMFICVHISMCNYRNIF